MDVLKVLITNNALAGRGGSEMYVRDIATSLLERGHTPIVYSTVLGEVAQELIAASIPVVDDLNNLAATPDVIHGQHHMETMTALLHFPGVPAIQFCHGWDLWNEAPLRFPRILRYVAVDQTCRDRLLLRQGIPEQRIEVLLNFVDMKRFRLRSSPLPHWPQRAVVFSNHANEDTHLRVVREACRRSNIKLDVIGSGVNNPSSRPEQALSDYDLVFAKGKCALEALAVGAAVIVCDARGVGPMVTTKNFERLRPLNFGLRTQSEPLDSEIIEQQINHYDPLDALKVSQIVRSTADRQPVIDRLVDLYWEVIHEYANSSNGDVGTEGRAAAAYLRQLKLDLAKHGAASLRLRERVLRLSLVGKLGIKFARLLTGHPDS